MKEREWVTELGQKKKCLVSGYEKGGKFQGRSEINFILFKNFILIVKNNG